MTLDNIAFVWIVPALSIGILAILAIVARPIIGLCMVMGVLIFGRAFSFLGENLSPDRIAAGIFFLCYLGHRLVVSRTEGVTLRNPVVLPLAIFEILACASLLWTIDTSETASNVFMLFQILIMTWAIVDVCKNMESVILVFRTYVITASLVSLAVMATASIMDENSSGQAARMTISLGGTISMNPNLFSFRAGIAFLLVQFFYTHTTSNFKRTLWLFTGGLLLLAMLKAASRTALLGILSSLVIPYLWINAVIRRPMVVLAIISAVTGAVILIFTSAELILPQEIAHRITDAEYFLKSFDTRAGLITDSLRYVAVNPFGAGLGAYRGPEGYMVHNDLFSMISDLGILGGIFYIFLVARMSKSIISIPDSGVRLLGRSILIFLVITGIGGMHVLSKEFWYFLILIGVLSELSIQDHQNGHPEIAENTTRLHDMSV